MRTVAIVLAGGTGARMGLDIPKQFLKVSGRTVLEHTLDAIQSCPQVDDILLVMAIGYEDKARGMLEKGAFPKVSRVLSGGRERSESSLVAIEALGDEECKVLFHDAVRPFISKRVIEDCIAALDTHQAVDTAIPSADTIIEVHDDVIAAIPPRESLRRGQTPQAFHLSTIRRAYELAAQDPSFSVTDDCGVVLKYLPEVPIFVVDGSDTNIKITHAVDIFIADKLFQLRAEDMSAESTPDGQRAHLTGKTLVVFGGSYGIGREIVERARERGATVFSFSRSETGTHIESGKDIEAALDEAYTTSGRIDYVVNTAAILSKGLLTETSDETIDEQVKVNFVAPVVIARASQRYLEKTAGQLLFFTSSSYTRGRAEYSLYSSTKAAVVNLTQALADEWSAAGVRVNCINPERTKTPMRLRNFGEEPEESLLAASVVAETSLQVLISDLTGLVIDVRRREA